MWMTDSFRLKVSTKRGRLVVLFGTSQFPRAGARAGKTCPRLQAGPGVKRRVAIIELLYQALSSDRGIVVQAEGGDLEQLRQKLYQERTKAADPDLEILSFVPSPTDPTQLWIVKRKS